MLKLNSRQLGFTIVELLIVIVIIGILASISIVAYTGIQDRANAAKAAAVAKNYMNIFQIYRADHGTLHPGLNWHPVCLGPPGRYPAEGVFEEGECVIGENGSGTGHRVMQEFNQDLIDKGFDVPAADLATVTLDEEPNGWRSNVSYRGMIFHHMYDYDAGQPADAYIRYFLRGTHVCPQGETHTYDGVTECVITIKGDGEDGDWGKSGGEGF